MRSLPSGSWRLRPPIVVCSTAASDAGLGGAARFKQEYLAAYAKSPIISGVQRGEKDAPVTLVVLNYYGKIIKTLEVFYSDLLPELERNFVDQGLLRIVAMPVLTPRNVDVGILCVDYQDMGWELNVAIYGRNDLNLDVRSADLDWQEITHLAEMLPINIADFSNCIQREREILSKLLSNGPSMIRNPLLDNNTGSYSPAFVIGSANDDELLGRQFVFLEPNNEVKELFLTLIQKELESS